MPQYSPKPESPTTLHFVEHLGLPQATLAAQIQALSAQVLPSHRAVDLAGRMGHAPHPFSALAFAGGKLVGFKLGYSDRPKRFYSWLGGVAPDWRRQGIARDLMARQHAWCRTQGFTRVRTHSTNTHRGMLVLNLSMGFDVVGTVSPPGKGLKIVLEKAL